MTPADLRRFRERRGWSKQRLADALGVSLRTIYRWEKGEARLPRYLPAELAAIAAAEAAARRASHHASA